MHIIEDIVGELPTVYRNDEIALEALGDFDAMVLSPGPGIPDEAGILKEAIRRYAGKMPIFGVCLGLQAITEVFGGRIENLNDVYHGVATDMTVLAKESVLFRNIPAVFPAARYHSWIASSEDFPTDLDITAVDEFGSIMALQHKAYPLYAVQFHPESILTPDGKQMIQNFIESIS